VAPIEPWLTGGPYKWSFHYFWNLEQIINVYTGMWNQFADKTTKVVGGFWPNDPDGTVWAQEFSKKLKTMGYKVVDVGRFRPIGPPVGGNVASRGSFPSLPRLERHSSSRPP
jgi:branched-chain amino acid transport system substrate-binding protein